MSSILKKKLLTALAPHLHVPDILRELGTNRRAKVQQILGSSFAFLLHELHQKEQNILVVTPDSDSAGYIYADLLELETKNPIHFLPTHQKPYDSEHLLEISSLVNRAEALEEMLKKQKKIVVSSAEALFEKVASSEKFSTSAVSLANHQHISIDELRNNLVELGFRGVEFIDEPGEFAVRGGIFDIFSFSGEYPVRLEFFGDEIDAIREFDPASQRSVSFLEQTRIVPNARNFSTEDSRPLLEYLKENSLIVALHYENILADLENRFNQAKALFNQHAGTQPDLPSPESLYLNPADFKSLIAPYPVLHVGGVHSQKEKSAPFSLGFQPQPVFNGSFKLLRSKIEELTAKGAFTYILCDNDGQKNRFEELLGEENDAFRYGLITQTLHEGFICEDAGIAVFTDHQIFNRFHRPKTKKKKTRGGISFKELKDLHIGDFVVHVDYGIGKFAGFKQIEVRGIPQEAVMLHYKDDSVLYVNVSSLHKLQKYSGKEGTQPKITKLGSGEWARKKAQTKAKVKDIARELILLYAKRKSQKAYSFSPDNAWQIEMEANFEFEETPDQISAIEKVKSDMENEQPMDRLVCGDVGFGKTEIAIRAAFKAVMNGKQVAVLVPTTILAEQHFKTFSRRMNAFPVKVESLSRFKSKARQKNVIRDLENGTVDILIGTHRIVSKDVRFKELGLLIIDEEQRFGVSVKEKLKEMRASVDVLTLTATPIPRTLQFSLMGARDLSVITTPPPNRQPVFTEIHSFNEALIRDAISQELSRGGQVFFIHNRVKNIEEMADMIRYLIPECRVRHAHGQMLPSQLEKIISDFYAHKFDVLVSTNIVENGIDIANANTIIINQANHFGLSELHQLRGRVGRSNQKAFCYLITPPVQNLTPEARKRLLALEEFSDLGSGFNIAMRDLDIRGAGDILGAEQSGFINEIGFELYSKILNDAVRELKETEFEGMFAAEAKLTELPETQVEFDTTAMLPEFYVKASVERLNLYRRLAECTRLGEVEDWKSEIEDRFGKMPVEAERLYIAAKIKIAAARLLLPKITIRSGKVWLLCPVATGAFSEIFFGEGMFQNLLKFLENNHKGSSQVTQKNEELRIVIDRIPDLDTACALLIQASEKLATTPQAV